MRNKLRIMLLSMLLLFGSVFFIATSTQAFAASDVSSVSQIDTLSATQNVQSASSYQQGYQAGHNDAVSDCIRNTRIRPLARGLSDYSRGYVNGYDNARTHDRACTHRPQLPSNYIRGYQQGYNDAVTDCSSTRIRPLARSVNDYNRGYTDGYNFARTHDRACTKR